MEANKPEEEQINEENVPEIGDDEPEEEQIEDGVPEVGDDEPDEKDVKGDEKEDQDAKPKDNRKEIVVEDDLDQSDNEKEEPEPEPEKEPIDGPADSPKPAEDGISIESTGTATVPDDEDKELDLSSLYAKFPAFFGDETNAVEKYTKIVRKMFEMEEEQEIKDYYIKQLDTIEKYALKSKTDDQLLLDLYSLLENIRKAYMQEAIESRPELRGLYQGIKEVRKIKSELYDDLRREFAGEHVNWVYELFGYASVVLAAEMSSFKPKDEKQLSLGYQYMALQTAIIVWSQKLTLQSKGIWDSKTIRIEITRKLLTGKRSAVAIVDKSNPTSMLLAFRRKKGNALDAISYHVFTRDRLAPVVHMWGFFMLETALKQIKKNGDFAFVDGEKGPNDRSDPWEIILNSKQDGKEIAKLTKTTASHMGGGHHYYKHVKSHMGSPKISKVAKAVTLGADRYDEDESSEEYQPYL